MCFAGCCERANADEVILDTPNVATKEETRPNGLPESPEEKVAVLGEEPPPIQPLKTAPGMSATSGPLEDFPEGGYQ